MSLFGASDKIKALDFLGCRIFFDSPGIGGTGFRCPLYTDTGGTEQTRSPDSYVQAEHHGQYAFFL